MVKWNLTQADADAQQIFDPVHVSNLFSRIAALADVTVTDGGINTSDLGTEADPKSTYCSGTCKVLAGDTVQGAGLLVIDGGNSGKLEIEGDLFFRGLILINGQYLDFDEYGEIRVLGSIVQTLTDGVTYSTLNLDVDGTSHAKLYYQESGIQLGVSLLPHKMTSRREITPDVEPAF